MPPMPTVLPPARARIPQAAATTIQSLVRVYFAKAYAKGLVEKRRAMDEAEAEARCAAALLAAEKRHAALVEAAEAERAKITAAAAKIVELVKVIKCAGRSSSFSSSPSPLPPHREHFSCSIATQPPG